jgi:GxxExxY protein
MNTDQLTEKIISAANEVHRTSGPGLHEAEYEECLCYELSQRELSYERQKPLPVQQNYKGRILDCGYRMNLVVEDSVIVELKYCEKIESLHKSQLLAFLKLSGLNRVPSYLFFEKSPQKLQIESNGTRTKVTKVN